MSKSGLILESSLQTFFFDHLLEVNNKSIEPLPKETIYYSSLVMDRFGLSQEYFEEVDGKIRDKVLGLKLLQSGHFQGKKQQRELKDIGDTALFLCGFFSESVNPKILDLKYYREVGQIAYSRLDAHIPSFYDVQSFYRKLSHQFETLTTLMKIVQQNTHHDFDDIHMIVSKNLKAS
jgi:hypothetical protein